MIIKNIESKEISKTFNRLRCFDNRENVYLCIIDSHKEGKKGQFKNLEIRIEK
jgi:hypothetical protein